jgi:hypothetical protein
MLWEQRYPSFNSLGTFESFARHWPFWHWSYCISCLHKKWKSILHTTFTVKSLLYIYTFFMVPSRPFEPTLWTLSGLCASMTHWTPPFNPLGTFESFAHHRPFWHWSDCISCMPMHWMSILRPTFTVNILSYIHSSQNSSSPCRVSLWVSVFCQLHFFWLVRVHSYHIEPSFSSFHLQNKGICLKSHSKRIRNL